MDSIVLELQREALDSNNRTSDLLRKALVVARKLGQKEFQTWIENEFRGYTRNEDIPEYRKTFGQIQYCNPYHGWQPIQCEDADLEERLTTRMAGQTIAELDDTIQREDNKIIGMSIPVGLQTALRNSTGVNTELMFVIPESQIVKILDAVRNIVLNWALNLEEQGIFGENLSFSEKEKEAASTIPQNINYFLAPVQNPQIQQGNVTATQTSNNQNMDLEALRIFISEISEKKTELNLEEEKAAEVNADINTIKSQLDSPKPKKAIISESLDSIRKILEGAGGSVAAQLLIELGKAVIS